MGTGHGKLHSFKILNSQGDEIATFPFLMPTLITATTATASLLQSNFFETQILHYPETRPATWENRLLVRFFIFFYFQDHKNTQPQHVV